MGNIFVFCQYLIIDRLTADVKRPFLLDDKLTRIDDTPIHKGLRECLANALIHADHYGRRGIVIDKEFRKITISNPGTFRVDINAAIAGGISDVRNSVIFNMFSLINVGERSGVGLCDVYNAWKANGYKEPEFVEMVDPDRITLTLQIESVNADGSNGTRTGENDSVVTNNGTKAEENDSVGVKSDVKVGTKLSENEKAVYNCIQLNNDITTKAISDDLGISLRTVQRCLTVLKENGLLLREGSKTNGRWVILK